MAEGKRLGESTEFLNVGHVTLDGSPAIMRLNS